MEVSKLRDRIFQIYIYTILFGTFFTGMGIGILSSDISELPFIFLFGFLITATLSLPNFFILNRGLKYIYRKAKNESEKRHSFIYLWIVLCAIPLFPLLLISINSIISDPIEVLSTLFMALPYMLSSLYFIFQVNNKYDKIYPPNFSKNRETSIDILDDDFNV